jgi:iron complex transport system substrate-binding protein
MAFIKSQAFALLFILAMALVLLRCLFPPSWDETESGGEAWATVEDMAGRLVDLDGPARRVMLLTPVSWHYLTVELTDEHVLMVPPYMRREYLNSPLNAIFPRMAKLPLTFLDNSAVSPFSVEESMIWNPDVILSWDYIAQDFDNAKIKGLIKISADKGEKEKLFEILGGITGKSDRVAWLYERCLAKKQFIIDNIEPGLTPKTFIVIANENFSMWGQGNFKRFNEITGSIGGVNLAPKLTNRNGTLNVETLMDLDPDDVYINPNSHAFTSVSVKGLLGDPRFQGLRAVREGRVYRMPRAGSRLEGPVEEPLFMLWLYETLHPEGERIADIRKEIKETYEDVYDYSMSEAEVDQWLRISENSLSKYYSRLFKEQAIQ